MPASRAAPPRPSPSLASSTRSAKPQPPPSPAPALPATLAKRLLFPHLPPGTPIPPLLADPALDAELYDFLALALRAFVTPWWSKITRYDKEFLPHITHILSAVLRALDARIRATDPAPLLCRHVPALLAQHYDDYRAAARDLHSSRAQAGALSLPALFHARQQHIAVSPDGVLDELYVRTVLDAVLNACLPAEDWDAEPERYIVREIVLHVVCSSVVPKITQPWFIHKSILDLLGPEVAPLTDVKPPEQLLLSPAPSIPDPASSTPASGLPSLHTLLVFFLSAVQSVSTAALTLVHLYKQTLHTIQQVNQSSRPPSPGPAPALGVVPSPPLSRA
ncbi:hypothetical protein HETIRDRAFT_469562, partial [Heterobasidion irregulare TC 32-1]